MAMFMERIDDKLHIGRISCVFMNLPLRQPFKYVYAREARTRDT